MEKITQIVLRNRLLVLVVSLLVVIFGLVSYFQLPVNAFPDVSPVLVQVFTVTQGLSPVDVEKYVTYPIEVSMNGLPNLKKIRSISNFGLSVVNIYFKDGTDIYFARQLVNERLRGAKEGIPAGFGEPELGPIATGMGLVLFYYLKDETGQRSLTELRTIQDWTVKPHLQNIPGVTEVLGIGGHEKQFHIIIKPQALLRYKVGLNQIVDKIKANNLNIGGQFIIKNGEEYVVRSVGLASGQKDLEGIVIKSFDGSPVYLKDVASIQIGGAIRRGLQTRNSKEEVVAGMVIKLYGSNSSTVIKKIEKKIQKIASILPNGVKIVPYYEQRTLVEACVSTVSNALLQGIVLVGIIIVVFLSGFRPSLVVILSLPFSMLFATLGMRLFGISANLMSLGGLAIAIGMLVDGTIVVVENVDRLLQESSPGKSKFQIVLRACAEVGRPIFFAILIIIVVFLPLFTLQGVEGKTFRPLAYTVALAMLGSLIYALVVAPVLSELIMRISKRKTRTTKQKTNLIDLIGEKFKPMVASFVGNSKKALIVIAVLFMVGVFIFPQLGSEFTPVLQEGSFLLRITLAPSISLKESKRMTMLVEKRLLSRIPEIREVVSRIGRGEVGAHSEPVNNVEMIISLKPKSEWKNASTQKALLRVIRKRLGKVPGMLLSFTQPIAASVDELIGGVKAQLAIKIIGEDLGISKRKAEQIASIVRKIEGAADVQVDQISGTPQLLIKINRNAIARYGINVSDVQAVIKTAVGGEVAGQIFEGVKRFDIFVRFAYPFRKNKKAIERLLVHSPSGTLVPLRMLADIKEVVGIRQITRENSQRFLAVQCNVAGRDIGSFVAEAKQQIKKEVKLPPGYLISWGGQFQLQQEANKKLMVVIPITLLVVFILLFSIFNSLKKSLLILINIPFALVGGVVGLWLTGQNLSVPASVGFIALFGIALENSLVLVTYLNSLVKKGISIDKASVQAAVMRLRPVLMTALTTGLGLIPLILSSGIGSEVQRPLATVVLGGLVTSTPLTLLIIPALYKWFAIEKK